MKEEKVKSKLMDPAKFMKTRIMVEPKPTGFHGDTSEQEIERLLRETITETGMPIKNAMIECPAKPITHGLRLFQEQR